MPGVGPVATVAVLTVLQPSPYLCQLLFIFFRELVGHERPRPSVLVAPGAFCTMGWAMWNNCMDSSIESNEVDG